MRRTKSHRRSHVKKTNTPKLQILQQFQGLPNIGNICFLNSVLQQIFRLQMIKQELNNHFEKYKENPILSHIGKLFASMKDNKSEREKIANLRGIQQNLKEILLDYETNSQHDSYQTLIGILNLFIEKNPELRDLFQVKSMPTCQCLKQQVYITQLILKNEKVKCSRCMKEIQMKIVKFPKYLICTGQNSKNPHSLNWLTEQSLEKNKEFCLLSENIYIGNKKKGHYYSICYIKNKGYKYDDKIVSEFDQKERKNQEKCMFAIYEVKQRSLKETINQTAFQLVIKETIINTNIGQQDSIIQYTDQETNKNSKDKDHLPIPQQKITPLSLFFPTLIQNINKSVLPYINLINFSCFFIFLQKIFLAFFRQPYLPTILPSFSILPKIRVKMWRYSNFIAKLKVLSTIERLVLGQNRIFKILEESVV